MEHFNKLNSINVNENTEKKKTGTQVLTYLSWAWAWTEVKKLYPNASYEIKKFDNNLPYIYDDKTGYMVFTNVTIEGITHEMWLPVMDGSNKAMKSEPYTYQVNKYTNGKLDGNVDKTVESATMFDINKTIMRCLTKNLAMFGLGLYIYAGEDLPENEEEKPKEEPKKAEKKTGEYITEEQIKILMSLEVDMQKLAKHFQVESFRDLTKEQGAKAIKQRTEQLALLKNKMSW